MQNNESIIGHYKYVVEHANDLRYLKDNQGMYLAVSRSIIKYCNMQSVIDIVGHYDYEMVWGDLANDFLNDDINVIDNHNPSGTKYLMPVSKGLFKIVKTIKEPVRGCGGEILAVLGCIEEEPVDFLRILELLKKNNTFYRKHSTNILSPIEITLLMLLCFDFSEPDSIKLMTSCGINIGRSSYTHVRKELLVKLTGLSRNDLITVYKMIGFDYVSMQFIRELCVRYSIGEG